jgi:hypothetical protein
VTKTYEAATTATAASTAGDALPTGTYGKTLTYTLSTTSP